MYALLTSKESLLPIVISMNSRDYTDFIMCGMYIQEDTGSKREMESAADNLLRELCAEMD